MISEGRLGQKNGLSRAIKVIILCLVWYSASSASNIINKIVLNDFPLPLTVSFIQNITTLICLYPLIKILNIPKVSVTTYVLKWTILPLSFGKFFSTVSSHFSISKVAVSYAHTIKASMPIFVLLLGRVIWGERQPVKIYCSVIPIFIGIGMATISEINFDLVGTLSAFVSTIGFALQGLYTKKALSDLNMHQHLLLQYLSMYGLIMMLPLWLYTDAPEILIKIREVSDSSSNLSLQHVFLYLFMSGVMAFLQGVSAFTIISLISTVSYSVANATKRIVVIVVSILTLKNPVTAYNFLGMMVACFGVFNYNRVKRGIQKERSRQVIHTPFEKNALTI